MDDNTIVQLSFKIDEDGSTLLSCDSKLDGEVLHKYIPQSLLLALTELVQEAINESLWVNAIHDEVEVIDCD